MKKTYNQPTSIVVELGCRFALLGLSSGDLDGTEFGGGTSGKEFPDGGDVKGMTDVNLWDEEW